MTERDRSPEGPEPFQALFESMSLGVVYQDRAGVIIAANPAAERLLGLSLAELQRQTAVDPRWRAVREDGAAFPDEQQPALVALRTGRPVHGMLMGIDNPQRAEPCWIIVDAVPQFRAGEAVPYQVFSTLTEITGRPAEAPGRRPPASNLSLPAEVVERGRMTSLLTAQAKQYQALIETTLDGYLMIGQGGRLLDVNATYCRLTGWSRAELLAKNLADLVEDPVAATARLAAAAAGGALRFETRHRRAAGGFVDLETSTTYLPEAGCHLSFLRDISEQKQAQAALLESETKFRAIFENSMDAIAVARAGRHLMTNRAYQRMFDYADAELLGRAVTDLIPPDGPARGQGELAPGVYAARGRRRAGAEFVIEVNVSTYTLAGQLYTVLIVRDITDRKRAEAKILRLNRLYATLSQINQAIVHTRDQAALFEAICQVAVTAGQFRMAWIGVVAAADPRVQPVAIAGDERGYLTTVPVRSDDAPGGHGPTGRAVREGICIICQDIATDPRLGPWRASALERGYRSSASVPIRLGQAGRPFGALTVYAGEPYSFDADDERLLDEIGLSIAFALEQLAGEAARQQSEAALRRSEASLRAAQRIARLGNWEFDLLANKLTWSEEVFRILGLAPDEAAVTWDMFQAALHPDDRGFAHAAYVAAVANGQPFNIIHRIVTPDGGVKFVRGMGEAVYDAAGRPVRATGILHDITDQHAAEQALRESEARFRQIMENIQLAAVQLDTAGTVTFCNAFALALIGWPREAVMGCNWFDLAKPAEVRERDRQRFQALVSGAQPGPYTAESRLLTRSGEVRYVTAHNTPLFNPQGQVSGVTILDEDITERKRAEAALALRTQAVEASLGAIAIADLRGRVTDVNPAFLRLWGYPTAAEVLGRPLADFCQEPAAAAQIVAGLQTRHQWVGELAGRRRDDSVFEMEISANLVRDEAGRPVCLMAAFSDLTERKRAEAELRALNAELERRVAERTADLSRANVELARAARLKDEFLSSMSHELRTPLNGILSLSESLEEGVYGPLTAPQLGPLKAVAEAGRHLLELINDILDLSKIEAGKLELRLEAVSVAAVCQASLRLIKQPATHKRLRVSFTQDHAIDGILADERRLRQMLVNLLGNAVKFTPEGGQIGLEVTHAAAAQVVRFSVWDTGIGIAPEKQGLLFQPFSQIDSSLARQYSGTGLGLSLVRRLAELHGGRVGVESALGRGSRFFVELPLRAAAAVPELDAAVTLQSALVVDDSVTASDQLARYLKELGAEVAVEHSGERIVERAAAIQAQVIFLDLLMPGRSGWEVLAALQADPRTQAIPVVIVSVIDEHARSQAAGAAGYLVKPPTREALRPLLRRVLGQAAEPAPAAPPALPAGPEAAAPLILVAEDNPTNQRALHDFLEAKGYRVDTAGNGREALEQAQARPPALILMDVQMPQMDGLEAMQRLRAQPEFAHTPIIALTALAMPGDRERCLAAGASAYLTKPMRLRELLELIQALLPPAAS